MAKKDIKDLRIDETEFYDEYCVYNRILERHNITKVSQLLDEEFIKKIAKGSFGTYRKRQLNKLIELIRYKYLNEDGVTNTELLDEEVSIRRNVEFYKEKKYGFSTLKLVPEEDDSPYYYRGIDLEEFLAIPNYVGNNLINLFLENIESIRNQKEDGESIKVIDFIRFIVDTHCAFTASSQVYLEIYEREKVAKDDQEIENKIQELVSQREYINSRIAKLKKLQKTRQKDNPKVYIKED